MSDINQEILSEEVEVVEEFPKNAFTRATKDPTLLVAKGRFYGETSEDKAREKSEHIYRLSNKIVDIISTQGEVKVRAVGDSAVASAVKAIMRASSVCYHKSNIQLHWVIYRQKGNIGALRGSDHVKDIGATVFKLAHFKKENNHE